MRKLTTAMSTIVRMSIFLRPTRSPKWPKIRPPNGRARYPVAKVPSAKIVPVMRSRLEKKTSLKTRAAAVE